jgi:hypothetical protein
MENRDGGDESDTGDIGKMKPTYRKRVPESDYFKKSEITGRKRSMSTKKESCP